LGQVYAGRPLKALLFFLAILPTYVIGLWLTDFTCVNPAKYPLEFVAHVLLGGPTLLTLHLTDGRILESMPRWFEVGRLYAAVGALLNVVAVSDALGEVVLHNRRVEEFRRRAAAASMASWADAPYPDEPAPEGVLLNGDVAPPEPEADPTPRLPFPAQEEPR
jgi:hypothetical protein